MDFISQLLDLVFPPRNSELFVRTVHAEDLRTLVQATELTLEGFSVRTLLPFRTQSVRSLIHEAKYHAHSRAQEVLGEVLGSYLDELFAELRSKGVREVVFVPMPLSRSRLRERGFNQCEVLLQNALHFSTSREGITFSVDPNVLHRIRDTEHQTALSKAAREANVKDAFSAPHPLNPDCMYVLFDDVVTTGASMAAALAALRAAGATQIFPLALAR